MCLATSLVSNPQMIELDGQWLDGKTAERHPATLAIDASGLVQLRSRDGGKLLFSGSFANLAVSPRLGSTPRLLQFPDGQMLETTNNGAVDRALSMLRPRWHLNWVHRLESHWRFVALTLLLVVAFTWGLLRHGLPLASELIAQQLPPAAARVASQQTLEMLDRGFLGPSQLDEAVQQRVREHFRPAMAQHADLELSLHFRDGGMLGANAFALPDGTLVFTDQMVAAAGDDDELLAVLAHEIGHVRHQHGMRSVIQSSLLAFTLIAVAGDVSGTAEIVLGLPLLLTELAYSRGFEREADDYALQWLRREGISPGHFVTLMQRLEHDLLCESESADASAPADTRCPQHSAAPSRWRNYLSTHPSSAERSAKFQP